MATIEEALCERGNTLLVNDDGDMVAWLTLSGDERLEVSWCPGNYPALNVRPVTLTDAQLAEHINNNLCGWLVRRCHVGGVHWNSDEIVVDLGIL